MAMLNVLFCIATILMEIKMFNDDVKFSKSDTGPKIGKQCRMKLPDQSVRFCIPVKTDNCHFLTSWISDDITHQIRSYLLRLVED